MEDHFWTSSFWRLLSTCSDSRKLLIVQKVVLHRLGYKCDFSNELNIIGNEKLVSVDDDEQSSVQTDQVGYFNTMNNLAHLVKQLKDEAILVESNDVPGMGHNGILLNRQNDNDSKDSKIIASLVETKFKSSKKTQEEEKHHVEVSENKEVKDLPTLTIDNKTNKKYAFTQYEHDLIELTGDETESKEENSMDHSEHTSSNSSFMLSTTSSYNSFERNINCRTPQDTTNQAQMQIDVLYYEAIVQHQIIMETCKALDVCLSSKNFIFSREHIQAERILLLATYKKNIALSEIKHPKCLKSQSNITSGFASVSSLQVPLCINTQKKGYTHWFFAILSCGEHVFATNVATPDADNMVRFQEGFQFDDLQYDFEIDINIYMLQAKKNVTSKLQEYKKEIASCIRPFNKLTSPFHKTSKGSLPCCFEHRNAFQLWGKTTVSAADLNRCTFQVKHTLSGESPTGVVLMDFSAEVTFNALYSGFLTIRTENDKRTKWNRKWCSLQGDTLYYWNYPTNQEAKPIGQIRLQQCISTQVSVVDKSLCSRPCTLLIETVESTKCGTVFLSHFLSSDDAENLIVWKNCINAILNEINNWNLMESNVRLLQ